jgi:hypothetical protein
MSRRSPVARAWLAFLLCSVFLSAARSLPAQEQPPAGAGRAWSLDGALAQLKHYPRDPYLQYVALQLARRESRAPEVSQTIDRLLGNETWQQRNERLGRVDLFSLFTGALAVQESLQLDAMRGEGPGARRGRGPGQMRPQPPPPAKDGRQHEPPAQPRKGPVRVADLSGPSVKSHPWEQMLAGRTPEISPLARCVPEDFYLAEFRPLNKLMEAMEVSDLWATHLFDQATQEARTRHLGDRLKAQLAVETNRLLRPFYDLVVEEVAVTGSDLFVGEGSDVTLLFRIKQPDVFKARMETFLTRAAKARPDAQRTEGKCQGVPYVHLTTPDRAVHVFAAYPTPDLHVRSNSRAALERVLEAIRGKRADGSVVRRLGDTAELAYIRTLMPRGAPEEDGFVYLSDPFIRWLVGPALKLTERRRMLCYNHLRMIGHAALLYRTEHGRPPQSLEALAQAGCAPGVFSHDDLTCPDGGTYRLSEDGTSGVCSHHGPAHALTPCLEIPLSQVSTEEADDYRAFVEDYNRYWRTYFDPIALRLQVRPERYRLETIVLPLIDNSIYTGLARVLGGTPEPLDALPVPKRNIFNLALRLNKEEVLREAGLGEPPVAAGKPASGRFRPTAADMQCANHLKQIGLALHNYHDANGKFPAVGNFDRQGKPLLSWRVHILPYVEEDKLYREFHLNEPWDSAHNKKLLARMPALYRCPNAKRKEAGLTTYLAPVGRSAMFTGDANGRRMSEITDGLSNTILVFDAADERAVPWTKPEDLRYDPEQPRAGLVGHHRGVIAAEFADGAFHWLPETIEPRTLNALLTVNGGEIIPAEALGDPQNSSPPRLLGLVGLDREEFDQLRLEEFLTRGLGDQIGLHVYDAVPLLDFNLPGFLGMMLGSFSGRPMPLGSNELLIAFLIASLNAPVYISLPVRDAKVVDGFLDRLDPLLVGLARERAFERFFSLGQDFYHFPLDRERKVRAYSLGFGPVKWRVFWGRIGDGLYIASKPFILEDLLAQQAQRTGQAHDSGPAAHALVRMRPQNWDRVLADFRLGWAENNRSACLQNLGPLSSAARSLGAPVRAGVLSGEVFRLAERLYDVSFFCPEGGHYELAADGKAVTCSVHGSALVPRQLAAPADDSRLGRLLRGFGGLTVTFSFLKDGLHAVVTVERREAGR